MFCHGGFHLGPQLGVRRRTRGLKDYQSRGSISYPQEKINPRNWNFEISVTFSDNFTDLRGIIFLDLSLGKQNEGWLYASDFCPLESLENMIPFFFFATVLCKVSYSLKKVRGAEVGELFANFHRCKNGKNEEIFF